MSEPPSGDDLPRRRHTFWRRLLAFVIALALLAWFVDLFITFLLKAVAE